MCENKIKKAKEDLQKSCESLKKSIYEGEETFCEIIQHLWQTVEQK